MNKWLKSTFHPGNHVRKKHPGVSQILNSIVQKKIFPFFFLFFLTSCTCIERRAVEYAKRKHKDEKGERNKGART